jgi:hypothetical protein
MTAYSKFTDKELATFYRNAVQTASGCGGQGKRHRNNVTAAHIQAEMEARGLPIPSYEECYAKGQFNGSGSA